MIAVGCGGVVQSSADDGPTCTELRPADSDVSQWKPPSWCSVPTAPVMMMFEGGPLEPDVVRDEYNALLRYCGLATSDGPPTITTGIDFVRYELVALWLPVGSKLRATGSSEPFRIHVTTPASCGAEVRNEYVFVLAPVGRSIVVDRCASLGCAK